MTNFDKIKFIVESGETYDLACVILNVADNDCDICPRSSQREDRCNEDCESGIREWLQEEYDKNCIVWNWLSDEVK